MSNLSLSVFGSLQPTKRADSSYLEPGNYIARVARIMSTDPGYAKEQFENELGKMESIRDEISQVKANLVVDGVGLTTEYFSSLGFEKYKSITPNSIPSDFDYGAIGTTQKAMKKAIEDNWDIAKADLFYQSSSGYAVRKDNKCRVSDLKTEDDGVTPLRDEEGNHLSGPNTTQALQITEHALWAMGMDENLESCFGNFVKITVGTRKSKQTGNERQSVKFHEPATAEEYHEAREALIEE